MYSLCAGSIASFSLYGPRFLTDLHYTQTRVNIISITAELAMYLPVPLFGYLCDRYSPSPLSLLAGSLFGLGYILAAFAYKAGPPADAMMHEPNTSHTGYPFWVMVVAFVGIGAGTSCMYLSAVATCAKNFAKAKYRGFMLAVPIAAFGLSGMWQSQLGAHLLYQRLPDGRKGPLDVFKYFIFLAGLLIGAGLLGTLLLRLVDEEELIEEGVEHLEQSGLLDQSEFFRPSASRQHSYSGNYGTMTPDTESDEEVDLTQSLLLQKQMSAAALKEKKSWLLNHATHVFLTDTTMYLLAAGFLLLTGPGEAYINNVGTIIPSLSPSTYYAEPGTLDGPIAGSPASHVSIIALTSTLARLLTGTISDLFAPPSNPSHPPSQRITLSRLSLLIPSAVLLLLAFLSLAVPQLIPHNPSYFLTTSALLGLGYGASFSLVPIIISVVWGAENFATNWGVVAMMPAGGAVIWSLVYSSIFEKEQQRQQHGECSGYACYGYWALGCSGSILVAIGLWLAAWRVWRRRRVVV